MDKKRVNGNATLTLKEVRHIRMLLDTGQARAPEIARMYLMNTESVRRIGRRETWAWVPEVPELKSSDALTDAAAASLARVQASLGLPVTEAVVRPPEESVMQKMARISAEIRAKNERGDKLIDELKGETDGKPDGSTSNAGKK